MAAAGASRLDRTAMNAYVRISLRTPSPRRGEGRVRGLARPKFVDEKLIVRPTHS
jgi:hypothetical protein